LLRSRRKLKVDRSWWQFVRASQRIGAEVPHATPIYIEPDLIRRSVDGIVVSE
jgi:hypothetical protein